MNRILLDIAIEPRFTETAEGVIIIIAIGVAVIALAAVLIVRAARKKKT